MKNLLYSYTILIISFFFQVDAIFGIFGLGIATVSFAIIGIIVLLALCPLIVISIIAIIYFPLRYIQQKQRQNRSVEFSHWPIDCTRIFYSQFDVRAHVINYHFNCLKSESSTSGLSTCRFQRPTSSYYYYQPGVKILKNEKYIAYTRTLYSQILITQLRFKCDQYLYSL